MSQYRLYCINEDGHFSTSHEIVADDDAEALAKARGMKLPVKCELWSHDRRIAELPAHKS